MSAAAADWSDEERVLLRKFWGRVARLRAPSESSLTAPILETILEPIALLGCHPHIGAGRAGVPRSTFEKWLNAGRRDLARGADTIHAELVRGIEAAKAFATESDLQKIGSDDAWTARAWRLERHEPELYGQRREVNVTHRALPMIDTDRGTVEQLEQLYELLRVFSPDPSTPGLNKERRPVLELLPADVVEDSLEAPAPKSDSESKSPGA